MLPDTPGSGSSARATAALLQELLAREPSLREPILQQLLIALHQKRCVTVEQIYGRARERVQAFGEPQTDPNVGLARRWGQAEREEIERLGLELAAAHLTPAEVGEVVAQVRLARDAVGLEELARVPGVSFDELARRIRELCGQSGGAPLPASAEMVGTRVALVRHLLSDSLDYIGIAKHFMPVCSFEPFLERVIGPPGGTGRIGGKAAGLLLAHKILTTRADPELPGHVPPDLLGGIRMPESYFVRSDLFAEFLRDNGLTSYHTQKYKAHEEIAHDFPMIKEVFKNSKLPAPAMERLAWLLEQVGNHPLVVRSSSLLEDSFIAAFSGKYPSLFVGNQGSFQQRLDELVGAILEVYAGVLAPDPLMYRRQRHLIDYDESMAVLIQKVVGFRYRHFFLPAWAGVAYGRNEHRWSSRIRKEDGLVRLVMGLGTHAVDRVGDFPRMVNLTLPSLRPAAGVDEVVRYSQRVADTLNLTANRFERVAVRELLDRTPFPCLDQIVSIHREGSLAPPIGRLVDAQPHELVVTFDKLVAQGVELPRIKRILRCLEGVYRCPVDIEFAHDGQELVLLQCRPQSRRPEMDRRPVPADVPPERTVFSARHDVATGVVERIEWVVLVDPLDYERIEGYEGKTEVGRLIGHLNQKLAGRTFILMGPGRWGSADINLGVRVGYADICHTRVLIEIARRRGEMTPEVSYGTHFFQDLVELNIHYLPLYPDEPDVVYNEAFLRGSPNALAELLPEHAGLASYVRVIHVPTATGGGTLELVMDGEADRALAYVGGAARSERAWVPKSSER